MKVNPEDVSPEGAEGAAPVEDGGAVEDVRVESDGQPNEPETEEIPGKEGLLSVLRDVADADGAPPSDEDEPAEKKAEATAEDADAPPPFADDPRWQKVVSERDAATQELERVRGEAEDYGKLRSFMQDNNLGDTEVADLLIVGAMAKTDPASALKRVEEFADQLRSYLGEKLPDDLQEKVDSGYVDEETAKELARMRNQSGAMREATERQQRQAAEQAAAQQRAAFVAEISAAGDAWEAATATKDPDFGMKKEFVVERFQALVAQARPKTTADVKGLLDRAYADVNQRFAKLRPPKRANNPTNASVGVAGAAKPAPKSHLEALAQAQDEFFAGM